MTMTWPGGGQSRTVLQYCSLSGVQGLQGWCQGGHTSVLLHGTRICGYMVKDCNMGYAVSTRFLTDRKCYRRCDNFLSVYLSSSHRPPTKQI